MTIVRVHKWKSEFGSWLAKCLGKLRRGNFE